MPMLQLYSLPAKAHPPLGITVLILAILTVSYSNLIDNRLHIMLINLVFYKY